MHGSLPWDSLLQASSRARVLRNLLLDLSFQACHSLISFLKLSSSDSPFWLPLLYSLFKISFWRFFFLELSFSDSLLGTNFLVIFFLKISFLGIVFLRRFLSFQAFFIEFFFPLLVFFGIATLDITSLKIPFFEVLVLEISFYGIVFSEITFLVIPFSLLGFSSSFPSHFLIHFLGLSSDSPSCRPLLEISNSPSWDRISQDSFSRDSLFRDSLSRVLLADFSFQASPSRIPFLRLSFSSSPS